MKIMYTLVILLLLCEIGQWVINHYVIRSIESHNKSLQSILDVLKTL